MKTQAIHEEDLVIPVAGDDEDVHETETLNTHDVNQGDATPPRILATSNPQPEVALDGSTRIPIDRIEVDGSIYPRASFDKSTVAQYAAALIRKEHLPPITVQAIGVNQYRVLKGVLRFEAYCLRRDIHAGKFVGDFYDEPLPLVSETELNTIPCFIDTVPPDMHPMVFTMEDNLKHGKPLTSEDYKKIARQLYKDNLGAPIEELAKLINIGRKVFKNYVCDLAEAFEKEKESSILDLSDQGVSQTEISQILKDKFPKAKGLSQSQISDFLLKKDTAAESSHEKTDPTNDDREEVFEDTQIGSHCDGEGVEVEEIPPEPSPKPAELTVICGNSSDTILILGLNSLAPHLQEKLKEKVNVLVNQIREENLATRELNEEDTVLLDPEPRDEVPEKPELKVHSNQTSGEKPIVQNLRPAIQPSRGSRPLAYFS